MSQERVERLEALLSRVQENRKRAHTPAGLGLVQPAPVAPVARAEAPKPTHAMFTQTAAGLMPPTQPAAEPARPVSPAARPAPVAQPVAASPIRSAAPPAPKLQVPARNPLAEPAAPVAPFARAAQAPAAPAAAAAEQPRRPGQDRSATPLEMAVAELDHPAGGAKPVAPVAAAAAAANPMAPAIAPEEAFEARVIEPEPMREPARPIAQVVSRHSPQADATFGAMLKRSLSLRPH